VYYRLIVFFFYHFTVDLLNNIEGAGAIHVPAAPLFTVILALVGKSFRFLETRIRIGTVFTYMFGFG